MFMVIISLVSPFRKSERRRLITWVIFSAQTLGNLGNFQHVPTVENESVQVVVDLREESQACESSAPSVAWIKIPLGDNATEPEHKLFAQAIRAVVSAYHQNRKVAFHCGGGKGRTGTVAVGVLLELGLCKTIDEAEAMAKSIRPVISIKPDQRASLLKLYSGKA